MTPRKRTRPSNSEEHGDIKNSGQIASKTRTSKTKPSKKSEVVGGREGQTLFRLTMRDGVTLNMGDFSGFRRDVGLEADVYLDGEGITEEFMTSEQAEELDTNFDKMADYLEQRLLQAADDAQQFFDTI